MTENIGFVGNRPAAYIQITLAPIIRILNVMH